MREQPKKQPMTWKRVFHGVFKWQNLLVATAFFAMACFLAYICGNISATFHISDLKSQEYLAVEQKYLWVFAGGSLFALAVAIFSAYMVDHTGAIVKLLRKVFGRKKQPTEASLGGCAEGSLALEMTSETIAAMVENSQTGCECSRGSLVQPKGESEEKSLDESTEFDKK